MPNTREKLIELVNEADDTCNNTRCSDCEYIGQNCWDRMVADHLIANGVTLSDRDHHWATEQAYKNGYEQGKKDALAKDNNVPSKWIPASEPPKGE